ncbi:CAP domain-containing protein [Natronosalvus vescus]|uniref:CAP domain-containing protein n=1 Tax=Natronosalvus vescus TaxID=2953881 RepID=UPI002091D5C4|nr:CAP domain-containing protein [Natronosalvus vescus]
MTRDCRTDPASGSKSSITVGSPTSRGSSGVGSILIAIGFIGALVLAGIFVAPQALAYVEDELGGSAIDPPALGDRTPEHVDQNDPGETRYNTEAETVSSVAVEDRVHELVNERRAEHGLEPIGFDGTIASVSRAHSQDMYEREFAHVNPDGETPHDRFDAVADYCQVYSENIARTSVGTLVERSYDGERVEYHTADELAEGLVEQWMNSPEHRAAILGEQEAVREAGGWDRGGVGVYITDEGRVFATHNFCTVR